MGLFLELLMVDLAIYDVFVGWHLVADHEFCAVEVGTDRPDLEVVTVVDYDVFGVVVDSVRTAVTHFMKEFGG